MGNQPHRGNGGAEVRPLPYPLDLSGWTVTDATGYWVETDGTDVILATIPEPTSLALLGLGAAALLRRRRRA